MSRPGVQTWCSDLMFRLEFHTWEQRVWDYIHAIGLSATPSRLDLSERCSSWLCLIQVIRPVCFSAMAALIDQAMNTFGGKEWHYETRSVPCCAFKKFKDIGKPLAVQDLLTCCRPPTGVKSTMVLLDVHLSIQLSSSPEATASILQSQQVDDLPAPLKFKEAMPSGAKVGGIVIEQADGHLHVIKLVFFKATMSTGQATKMASGSAYLPFFRTGPRAVKKAFQSLLDRVPGHHVQWNVVCQKRRSPSPVPTHDFTSKCGLMTEDCSPPMTSGASMFGLMTEDCSPSMTSEASMSGLMTEDCSPSMTSEASMPGLMTEDCSPPMTSLPSLDWWLKIAAIQWLQKLPCLDWWLKIAAHPWLQKLPFLDWRLRITTTLVQLEYCYPSKTTKRGRLFRGVGYIYIHVHSNCPCASSADHFLCLFVSFFLCLFVCLVSQ